MSDHTFENPLRDYLVGQTRRQFFASAGVSAGSIALSGLLGQSAKAAPGESKNYGSGVHPSIPGLPSGSFICTGTVRLHSSILGIINLICTNTSASTCRSLCGTVSV